MNELSEKVKNELTFEKVLMTAMKTPGVKINRAHFLRKELIKYYPESVISEAIKGNPAKAGVSRERVNIISKQVINYETTKATSLSFTASLPGGAAALGAATVDITSYFVFILRVVQQLAYLYGFDEFELNENSIDAETMNNVLVFIGVMFGVQGASAGLQKVADALAKRVARNLANRALTKGAVYPIIKKIATSVGIRMTKQIFADTVASAIPVLGGALSGTLTFAMFKPGCMRLRKSLMQYKLSDPDYYRTVAED